MVVREAAAGSEQAGSGLSRRCVHRLDVAGRYEVGSLIRSDGRCCTHHAHDTLLRRGVSVTLATPETGIPIPRTLPLPSSARNGHGPGLGEIFDGGDDHGTLYLVIQAPAARTLAEELGCHRFTADEVRDLGAGIARALLPAHRRGCTHGALEADTVGLGGDRVTVAGLGVGEWLARWAQLEGSPRYPAPEQLSDREISPATDVFALGALLAEAAEPLRCEDPLAVLLGEMCADDPAGRPTTEEVIRLLTTREPAPPPPAARVALGPRPGPGRAAASGRAAAALGGLAVAAAVALAVVMLGAPGALSPARGATLSALSAAPVLAAPRPLPGPPHAAEPVGASPGPGAVVAAADPAALTSRVLLAGTDDEPTNTAIARFRGATSGAEQSPTTSYSARHEHSSALERPAGYVRDSAAATAPRVSASPGPRCRPPRRGRRGSSVPRSPPPRGCRHLPVPGCRPSRRSSRGSTALRRPIRHDERPERLDRAPIS